MGKLLSGEKYLSIKLLNNINIAAFKNKDKTKPEQPDFKGDGVAIWIHEYTPKNPKVTEENIL